MSERAWNKRSASDKPRIPDPDLDAPIHRGHPRGSGGAAEKTRGGERSIGCSAQRGWMSGRGILMGQRVSLLNGKIVAEVSVERERGVKGPLSTPQSRPAWVCVLRREKGRGRKREGRVKRVKVADKSRANREKWFFFFLPTSGGYSFSINRVLSVLIFQPPLPPVFLTAFPPNVLYEFLPFPCECSVQTASSREMNSKSRRCCCWRNN